MNFIEGDHVESGDTAEDYDHGYVEHVDDQGFATVSWQYSLTRSRIHTSGLREYRGGE